MSQKGSSVSNDNPEIKYKKALMEIQKIHNANKVLKSQSQEMKAEYERQINQLSISYQHVEKEYDTIKNQKAELEKFLEELQVSNSELRKEYNNLQREITYLNDVLTEQNTELRKVNAFKDEKGFSALITSYQDRQISYRKDIQRQQELLKSLKTSCQTLQNDLSEQRRLRFKLEDLNSNLKMETNKYRDLNNALVGKNENIVSSLLSRTSDGKEKYRQAEVIIAELSKQLDMVKSTRIQQQSVQRTTVSLDSYETVLQQKNKVEIEIHRLRQKLDQYETRSKQIFEMQQKMKRAVLRADQLQQQCNMMKSKLIVIETKDLMEGQGQDLELKQFQQRVIANIGQNDPLPAIKNSSDISHFQLMKAYIVELKQKLSKAIIDKKDYQRKYRSLKEKVCEKAEKAISLQQQNKLLKGKLEGFERLSERLQYELQKSIEAHEDEMTKMKTVTSSILNKKSEETKVTNTFIRAQLDLELDKFQKTEKGLRQDIQTIKLQLSTERIKNNDLQEKYLQTNEFLAIYKAKFQQINRDNSQKQNTNQILQENAMHFQQLYREQRVKNQALLTQKQSLALKISQINQQLERQFQREQEFKLRQSNYDNQARKIKAELSQIKATSEQYQNQLKAVKRELQQKVANSVQIAKPENNYYKTLQLHFQEQKQKNRLLQSQYQILRLRNERTNLQVHKVNSLEDALNTKNDELNDLRRKTIGFEKHVGILQAEMKQIKTQYQNIKKENNGLKAKLFEGGHQIRKSYESKDVESRRGAQRLSEQLTAVGSQLRQEKRNGVRIQAELQGLRNELRRYEQIIEQNKKKQSALSQELNQLRNAYQSICDESQRLKSEIKFKNSMQEGLNAEINGAQDRIFKLNQENTETRLKIQSIDNDYSELKREIGGLKVYINEIEQYANKTIPGGNWQEQRDKDNLSSFVQRLKRILKTNEIVQNTTYQYRTSYNAPSSNNTPLPDYLKGFEGQNYNFIQKYDQPSQESSPFKLNYVGEAAFKYDYN